MMPDFPHNIRIRLAQLNFFLFRPDVAKSLPCWLSQFSFSKLRQPQGRDKATSGCNIFFLIGPILFLYYKESLVSSILNSKLFMVHYVRPNLRSYCLIYILWFTHSKLKVGLGILVRAGTGCTYSWYLASHTACWNRVCYDYVIEFRSLPRYLSIYYLDWSQPNFGFRTMIKRRFSRPFL